MPIFKKRINLQLNAGDLNLHSVTVVFCERVLSPFRAIDTNGSLGFLIGLKTLPPIPNFALLSCVIGEPMSLRSARTPV
jgi:hypothetical protein